MHPNLLHRLSIIVGFSLFASSHISEVRAESGNPNILFIYLDDLGYGDLSCYNPKSRIQTPHIDQLAAEGLSFYDAHTPAAICGPSRYGLITGRYPWRRGEGGTGNGAKFRDTFIGEGRETIATVLKNKGYNTAQIGKWGIRHHYSQAVKPGREPGKIDAYDFPNKRLLGSQLFGFDYSWCMTWLYLPEGEERITEFNKLQFENGLPVDPALGLSDPYRWLPGTAEKVVEYLETYAGKSEQEVFGIDRSKPFFIYWDPPSPHAPLVVNKQFVGSSGVDLYGDFVVEIDHYVGDVLKAMEDLGLAEDTMVVFSSDNGPEVTCYERAEEQRHFSMGELRGAKRDLWEGGHRVPLIARWPGVTPENHRSDQLVSLTDWFRTFADMTGQAVPVDQGEDSVSLLPLLRGVDSPVRKHVVHHTFRGEYALRFEDWIFVDFGTGDANAFWKEQKKKSGTFRGEPNWLRKERNVLPHSLPGELFDLKNDPQQTINLFEKRSDKVKELRKVLSKLRN